ERLVPRAMMRDRIGKAKAAVLPEPVCAMPRMSRPASCAGMACSWIGLGTTRPAAWVAFSNWPVIPSAAKPVDPAKISCVNLFFVPADEISAHDHGVAQHARQ